MDSKVVSARHKPSIRTYVLQNLQTTFAITEKAELMTALLLIVLSAVLGLIGGLTAPLISQSLNEWQYKLSIGLVIFIIVQFLIITPFRMWRKAAWVTNIERMLDSLWDSHDRGVELLNAHYSFLDENPNAVRNSEQANKWVQAWTQDSKQWTQETQDKLSKFYPLEARGFENIVIYENRLRDDSLNSQHHTYRNMLLRRLEMLKTTLNRHQPALLPD